VDDVVDLDVGVVEGLLGLLGGGVGANVWWEGGGNGQLPFGFPGRARLTQSRATGRESLAVRTDLDGALGDHGAVNLVDDTVDLGHVVRVRDDLVIADDVLDGAARVS
jgi:hypothetical protein